MSSFAQMRQAVLCQGEKNMFYFLLIINILGCKELKIHLNRCRTRAGQKLVVTDFSAEIAY